MNPLDERSSQHGVALRTSPKFSDDHHRKLDVHLVTPEKRAQRTTARVCRKWLQWETEESIPMRKTIAKAVTWRLIGTAEIFAISFWTTGHIATAGHTAGIAAISSVIMYVAHELAWEAGTRNPAGSTLTRHGLVTMELDDGAGVSAGDQAPLTSTLNALPTFTQISVPSTSTKPGPNPAQELRTTLLGAEDDQAAGSSPASVAC